ncbi:DNA double-strand break repair nuclease NurA [Miniphocaeibacter massiliensis]|uniref:DNA double-strand break repair nuclease NurA n=1 Tax=Miniphocaeibacter massiliensis TaxID=2041841 RepID=UPI000C06F8C0|nr:DNA double-strand break repair nuclease NurA [Miniphocaeibacter massiliensis]
MDKEIITEVKKVNDFLRTKYNQINKYSRDEIREIMKNVGELIQVKKLTSNELIDIKNKGGVVGIDGSTNTFGGAYPHYIQLFQAVASFGINEEENIKITDFYCPLVDESTINEEKNIKDSKLASIEIEVAIKSTEKNPHIVLLDGSLIRYKILCDEKWEELKKIAEEKNIILVGVIEDIKTSVTYDNISGKDSNNTTNNIIYDRELLFNKLEYLESLYIDKKESGKDEYGFRSAFLRSSKAPTIIAVDILEEQEENLQKILSLIASITDVNSRGIPFILDLADVQTRISDETIEQMIKMYIDTEFYEKLFNAQRFKRSF